VLVLAAYALADRPEFLAKRDAGHVRLMCYNVNWDAIFLDDDTLNHKFRRHSLQGEFVRVVRAVSPDIICLQEINPARPARHIGDILDRGLPVDPDDDSRLWQAGIGQDNVIAARWPLTMIASDTSPPTGRGHAMALVDLPNEQYAADLYIINAHFKSAGGAANIARRTNHADAIMCWLRDAREPGGRIDLPQRTPIVICGDLNVYDNDPHRHLFTLTSGDILDETTFGPDFLPDWDNTTLADVLPVHNARGCQRWTWRDDTTKFNPGALDRVIYTDSVLEVAHAFVLNTATLTDAELAFTGLDKRDVALDFAKGEFDHLPIIVDFAFPHAAEPPSVPEPQPSSEPQPSPAPHP
jgi:endonuclease/exonuclease/phosphatase family metal-dependent hydrolase